MKTRQKATGNRQQLRFLLFTFYFLLGFGCEARATWHIYLSPIIGAGVLRDTFRPKYFKGLTWQSLRFGTQPWALVTADVDDATDKALQQNSDLIRLPDNLDQQVGAALATVQGLLEARDIPGNWVTAGTTYRTLIKTVAGMFAFMNRFAGEYKLTAALIDEKSVALNTQFNQLSAQNQQRLVSVAKTVKLDTSGFTPTATLRQLLKAASDQWSAKRPIKFGNGAIVISSGPSFIERAFLYLWDKIGPALAWALQSGSDNFQRGYDIDPIDGPWASMDSGDGAHLQIVGGKVQTDYFAGRATWTGYTSAPDQEASVSVYLTSDNPLLWAAVQVRSTGLDIDNRQVYLYQCDAWRNNGPDYDNVTSGIELINGAAWSTIASENATSWDPGDQLKCSAVDGDVTLYRNGSILLSAPNDFTLMSGQPGISVLCYSCLDFSVAQLGDFATVEIGPAGGPAIPRRGPLVWR